MMRNSFDSLLERREEIIKYKKKSEAHMDDLQKAVIE